MRTCFHRVLFLSLFMVPLWTPYTMAISASLSPATIRTEMSITSEVDNLERLFSSPFTPCQNPLPLRILSSELSWYVPKNKCSGLQHDGLSQLCKTQIFGSKEPWAIRKESRCASQRLFLSVSRPYPRKIFPRCQFQQSFGPLTNILSQNRESSFSVKTIDGVTESDVDAASITCRIFRHSSNRVKRGMRFFFL